MKKIEEGAPARDAAAALDVGFAEASSDAVRAVSRHVDGLPIPQRYWSAAAIMLAMAMSTIDSSIANVALPTIAQDTGASASASVWVVNAYQVAIMMGLLPLALLSEVVGYRKIYIVGLVLFALSSVGCVMAESFTALVISRFVQGFGAACVMAINGALVRFTYPKAQLGRGIGYHGLVVAITSAAGPSVAAAILAFGSWRWLFGVNIPLGLLSILIGFFFLPRVKEKHDRFDRTSAVLNAVTFGTLFLFFSDLVRLSPTVFTGIELASGLVAGVLLVGRSHRQDKPLVPLDLMRIPILRLSYATSASSFAALMMASIALPFLLQMRFGYDRVASGLLMTALPVGIALGAPVAGRLVETIAAGLLGCVGLLFMVFGLCVLALAPAHPAPAYLLIAMLGCGVGYALFQTPNNRTMMAAAPHDRSGAAGGMLAVSRLVGQTSGALLVALLFHVAGPANMAPLVIAACLALLGAVISYLRVGKDPE
ncbi:MAG: putative transport protein family [Bradyrhizobium sp.]|nr:putative transport protein family [Bradyrhizobium sp.]